MNINHYKINSSTDKINIGTSAPNVTVEEPKWSVLTIEKGDIITVRRTGGIIDEVYPFPDSPIPPATQYTFTINPIPSDATVIINGQVRTSLTADENTQITWEVSADGYISQSGTYTLVADYTLDVTLEKEALLFVQSASWKNDGVTYASSQFTNADDEAMDLLWQNGFNKTWSGNTFTGNTYFGNYPYVSSGKIGRFQLFFDTPAVIKNIKVVVFSGTSSRFGMNVSFYKPGSTEYTVERIYATLQPTIDATQTINFDEPITTDKVVINIVENTSYTWIGAIAINPNA